MMTMRFRVSSCSNTDQGQFTALRLLQRRAGRVRDTSSVGSSSSSSSFRRSLTPRLFLRRQRRLAGSLGLYGSSSPLSFHRFCPAWMLNAGFSSYAPARQYSRNDRRDGYNPWSITSRSSWTSSSSSSSYRPNGIFGRLVHNDGDSKEEGDDISLLPTFFVPSDDPLLHRSIRSCTKKRSGQVMVDPFVSDMSVCFFGTSSGMPSRTRNTSATLLKLDGTIFLFDVGEGTQRQLQFAPASIRLSHMQKIFITHLHGDHIFGLPGLLLGLQQASMAVSSSTDTTTTASSSSSSNEKQNNINNKKKSRQRRTPNVHVPLDEDGQLVVQIYGPPGLYHYIASSIILSCTVLHSITIEVYEMVGGRVKRVHGAGHDHAADHDKDNNANSFRNPFYDDYPEFDKYAGKLRRNFLHAHNGVWTISDLLTRDEKREAIMERSRNTERRFRIRAAEVDHLPGIPTFGFVVEEDEPPRKIDPEKAKALNVSPRGGRKFELLKNGFSVLAEDGSTVVEPSQVLVEGVTKRARKIAIVGDNRGWTRQMTKIAQNADVLVHEATLMNEEYVRGHSTAEMAGHRSADCNAGLLVLNHISVKVEADLSEKVKEAYEASGRIAPVLAAYDFLEIMVPWMGFGNQSATSEDKIDLPSASSQAVSEQQDDMVADGAGIVTRVRDWFRTARQ